MNADERNYKLKKVNQYKETLAPKWQRKWAKDLSSIEAKMTAEANRIFANNDKNHSEAMGSMEDI